MEIVVIEPKCLYAIKYKDEEFDEYNRIFEDYENLNKVLKFFELNKCNIGQFYVKELGLSIDETEAYAKIVIEEAIALEEIFEELIDNTVDGISPCIGSRFSILEGYEKPPLRALKSYGTNDPSMLRIYAIEISFNQLIIFYSGIKITHKISECPILRDNVIQRARKVIEFLKSKGIIDEESLDTYIEMEGME